MSKTSHPNQVSAEVVDNGKVLQRRTLRFASIDEAMTDVERIVAAERAGRLKRLGNWTVGQTLGHLASWAEYGYTGTPMSVPFYIRWFARLRKRKFLYDPMSPGLKIPRLEDGTLATEVVPLDEALERLQRVMQRVKTEAPTMPSKLLGPLTTNRLRAIFGTLNCTWGFSYQNSQLDR